MLHRTPATVACLVFALGVHTACSEDAVTTTSTTASTTTSAVGGGGGAGGIGGATGGGGAGGFEQQGWALSQTFDVALPNGFDARSVAATSDAVVYVMGGAGPSAQLLRLEADGSVASGWPVQLSVQNGFALRVVALEDGSAVAVGTEGSDVWVAARYALDGSAEWTTSFSPSAGASLRGMVVTPDGGVAILFDSGSVLNACTVAIIDAAGTEGASYTPTDAADAAEHIRQCSGIGVDADTADLLLIGNAVTSFPWSGTQWLLPALHRVPSDFVGGTTTRTILSGAPPRRARVYTVDGELTVTWTNAIGLRTPVSATLRDPESGAQRERYRGRFRDELPFQDALVFVAEQPLVDEAVTMSIADTAHDPPFPIASASLDLPSGGRIDQVAGSGDSVWLATSRSDGTYVTRYQAVADADPSPMPPATAPPTHEVVQQSSVTVGAPAENFFIERTVSTADGDFYVLGGNLNGLWQIRRYEANGQPSAGSWPHAFDFSTFAALDDTAAKPDIAALSDGSVVLSEIGPSGWRTQRIAADGTVVWTSDYGLDGHYPSGLVVDAQDRVVVFGTLGPPAGTSHVDCAAIRYDASGVFEAGYEIDLSAGDPAVTRCSGAAIDPTNDGVVFAGRMAAFPVLEGLARLDEDGVRLNAGAADGDILGALGDDELWVEPGGMLALPDGRLLAALTPRNMFTPLVGGRRIAIVDAAGSTTTFGDRGVGRQVVGLLPDGHVVRARQITTLQHITIEVLDVSADTPVVVGSLVLDPSGATLRTLAVVGDGTFWLSVREDDRRKTHTRYALAPM